MAKDKATKEEREKLFNRAKHHPDFEAYIEMVSVCYNHEGMSRVSAWLDQLDLEGANKCGKI